VQSMKLISLNIHFDQVVWLEKYFSRGDYRKPGSAH
jgi:hypothetical protein